MHRQFSSFSIRALCAALLASSLFSPAQNAFAVESARETRNVSKTKKSPSPAAPSRQLPGELRVPGGVALIEVGSADAAKPTVGFNQSNVWVAKRDAVWIAVVGIPLSASAGEHEITVTRGSESTVQRFNVKPKRYPEQRLTLNRDMVEPPLEVQARIERESAHLKTVRTTWSTLPQPTSAAFVIPSKGPLSSRFGQQRILNGKPRSPHAGLDVAAPAGTPIHAPGDGVVLDTGEYYYCGKTVFIDHGQGLITLYCHLSEIIAKPGDTVKQGDRIGLIGSTGRSTGPHLHWTVYLNGVAVEPELFLPSTAKKK